MMNRVINGLKIALQRGSPRGKIVGLLVVLSALYIMRRRYGQCQSRSQNGRKDNGTSHSGLIDAAAKSGLSLAQRFGWTTKEVAESSK